MMTDNKNLVVSIKNQNKEKTQTLIEKLPGHYQQFIETRKALRHIVELLKKLIKDNQAYKVNTNQDIENYEKNRDQMKEEYIKKINDVETERRYAYYNDYNLADIFRSMFKITKHKKTEDFRSMFRITKHKKTEDEMTDDTNIELKMIEHELKRRYSYYDEYKLDTMLAEMNRDTDGPLYEFISNQFKQKSGHRHNDQDQNQEPITDAVRLEIPEIPSASLNSIPDSFEDPVDLPILDRILPFTWTKVVSHILSNRFDTGCCGAGSDGTGKSGDAFSACVLYVLFLNLVCQ